jgi:molybdate transport system substrate-binding protein
MQMPRTIWLGAAAALLGVVIALATVACTRTVRSPAPFTVAAASSMRFALPKIIADFEKANTGEHVEAVYGSSGSLFSQIASNAPFDVFLSADENYAIELVKQRHGAGGSIVRYATGRLALWVPTSSAIDVSKGMDVLKDQGVKKIAIANPKLAPYGVAAEEALKKAGIYDEVRDRLVFGENIAQAAQFVESGAAQAGIVSLSMVIEPGMKSSRRYWAIPESEHAPIIQSGCVIASSEHQALAVRFLGFLQTEEAKEILRRYGFGIPGE